MPVIKSAVPVSGNAIRVVRTLRGLSRRELEQRSGIKMQRIFHIEKGLAKPTETEIAQLMGAMSTE